MASLGGSWLHSGSLGFLLFLVAAQSNDRYDQCSAEGATQDALHGLDARFDGLNSKSDKASCLLQLKQNRSSTLALAVHPGNVSFMPYSLDHIFIDVHDMKHSFGQEELLEARIDIATSSSETASGVLCQTLFHDAVHDRLYGSFAVQGLGADLAKSFDDELRRKCMDAFPDWTHLCDGYDGSWEQSSVAAVDNTIFGSMGVWLNEERKRIKAETTSWEDFRNPPAQQPEDSSMLGLLKHLSEGRSGLSRIMDFGCGDGVELSLIAQGLGLPAEDTLGVDVVDYVSKKVKNNMTLILAPDKLPNYVNKLQEQFESMQLRETVSAVFSQVTFHHIKDPQMRTAALTFIRDCLKPDGFLVLAEWDNSKSPIDYTIYFDLAHFLPALFFQDPAPTTSTLAPLNTEYLSIQGYIDLLNSNGLQFDSAASMMPWRTSENTTTELDPWAAANRSSGRNFLAVFGK